MEKVIIIIDEYLFDVTDYCSDHPGGSYILKKYHLKDATDEFNKIKGHSDGYALGLLEKFCIGHKEDDANKIYFKDQKNK